MPQDHLQPKDKPQTISVDGVKLTINPNVFDDLDVVEYLYNLQHANEDASNSFDIVPLLKKLTGGKYAQLKQALRDPHTGRVSMSAVSDFMTKLLSKVAPNSPRS